MRKNTYFIEEIYAKPFKKNYAIEKTHEFFIEDTWSRTLSDLVNVGPKKIKAQCKCILIIADNFSKSGWTVPSINKNAQTVKEYFEINHTF